MTQVLFNMFAESSNSSNAELINEELPFTSHFHVVVSAAKQKAFSAFLKQLGLKPPAKGMLHTTGNLCILNISPNQFWLIDLSQKPTHFQEAAISKFGWMIDLTGSRVAVKMSGDKVRSKLSRLAPIDFHEVHFINNMVVDTVCGAIPLTIWREGKAFVLVVPSSYALAFAHELAAA